MLFREPALGNDVHLSAPTPGDAPFDTAPYHLCGQFDQGSPGGVIGPDLVCTAGHATDLIPIGANFRTVGNLIRTVTQKFTPAVHGDLLFCKMNGTFPDYAWLWNNEYWTPNNWIFAFSTSFGRGPYGTNGQQEWWEVADSSTWAFRWGATRPDNIDTTSTALNFFNRFRLDNDPGAFGAVSGDSGSPCFLNAGPNGEWLYLGPIVGGIASLPGEHAVWDTPNSPVHGFNGSLVLPNMQQVLGLGGRVLPSQLTVTQPATGFTTGDSLVVRGTTIGNPSKAQIQLTY